MAAAESLNVYLGDLLIGNLTRENGRLSFQYHREWLEDPTSYPLSLSLPLRTVAFTDPETMIWFGNLLPEGDFLNAVARRLGRSTGDIFGLLLDLGGECAGAISLLPPGETVRKIGHYQKIGEDKLFALVADERHPPLLAGEAGVRLSLAGAQNKIPVYLVPPYILSLNNAWL